LTEYAQNIAGGVTVVMPIDAAKAALSTLRQAQPTGETVPIEWVDKYNSMEVKPTSPTDWLFFAYYNGFLRKGRALSSPAAHPTAIPGLREAVEWMDKFIADEKTLRPDSCLYIIREAARDRLAMQESAPEPVDALPDNECRIMPHLPDGWQVAYIVVRRNKAWNYDSGQPTYDAVLECGDYEITGSGFCPIAAVKDAISKLAAAPKMEGEI
jgi:hypothetical protein